MDSVGLGWDALVTALMGAFAVGVSGSAHCLLMCGPLACVALPGAAGSPRWRAALAFQVARVTAYALTGAVLGGMGAGVGAAFALSTQTYLPWVMAAALLASAFELGKRLGPLPGVGRCAAWVVRSGAKFSPALRAGAMGAATPLLPCGLLYGLLGAALSTGTPWGGAGMMAAFALGGVPALLLGQWGATRTATWPKFRWWSGVLRRAVPALAAAVLIYRALESLRGSTPQCH